MVEPVPRQYRDGHRSSPLVWPRRHVRDRGFGVIMELLRNLDQGYFDAPDGIRLTREQLLEAVQKYVDDNQSVKRLGASLKLKSVFVMSHDDIVCTIEKVSKV